MEHGVGASDGGWLRPWYWATVGRSMAADEGQRGQGRAWPHDVGDDKVDGEGVMGDRWWRLGGRAEAGSGRGRGQGQQAAAAWLSQSGRLECVGRRGDGSDTGWRWAFVVFEADAISSGLPGKTLRAHWPPWLP